MAAFVTPYGNNTGSGVSELTELVAIIDEPGRMCGTAAFVKWNSADIFVARV